MAYQPIINAFRLSGEEAGGQPSYMDALLKGFKGAQEAAETVNKPRKLQEEYLKQQLENKMNTPKAEGAQLAFDTDIGYKQALTKQANKPAKRSELETLLAYAQAQQEVQEQQQKKQSFIPSLGGDNDRNPMPGSKKKEPSLYDRIIQHKLDVATGDAKKNGSYAPSITAKELQEQSDAEAGYYPNTGRQKPFESLEQQKAYVDAYSAKTTGLKKGSHFVLSPTGERIGETRPKTPHERDVDKGTVQFKTFFPKVNLGLNYYSGEDSIRKMENDARNYKTDPAAKKRFDQLLLAQKLSTLTTVTEAARFGAGKQNQVFNRFNDSLSSFDVPKTIAKLIKEYQIPASANINAGLTFQKTLDESDNKYKRDATPNITEYYPGKAPLEQGAVGEARAMYKNGILHFIPIADIAEAKKLGYKDER